MSFQVFPGSVSILAYPLEKSSLKEQTSQSFMTEQGIRNTDSNPIRKPYWFLRDNLAPLWAVKTVDNVHQEMEENIKTKTFQQQ